MTNVIDQVNQKIDKILQKLEEFEKRIIDIEIVTNTIEKEIKNKSKSSKRNKTLIKTRNEEPIKIEDISYQKGSYDEWIYQTQLPKIKKDLEEINRLNSLSEKKRKEKGIIIKESKDSDSES